MYNVTTVDKLQLPQKTGGEKKKPGTCSELNRVPRAFLLESEVGKGTEWSIECKNYMLDLSPESRIALHNAL